MEFNNRNKYFKYDLFLLWLFYVSPIIANETKSLRFCRLCEEPTDKCFKNGLYQWFAQPWPTRKNPQTYDNYVTIYPFPGETKCKIEIAKNDGALEETLIITRKAQGLGKNNIWEFAKDNNQPFGYRISRRTNIKGA